MGISFFVKKQPNNTLLLLHGDEDPLVDSSPFERSLGLFGGIARDATYSKFGGYSIFFDGSNDYISLPSSSDLVLNEDFTIDFWFRKWPDTGIEFIYSHGQQTTPTGNFFTITIDKDEELVNVQLYNSGAYDVDITFSDFESNFNHYAITGDQSNIRAYFNGQLQSTEAYSPANMPPAQTIYLGYPNGSTPGSGPFLHGHIDEFRISNVVRWTSNFTPPTSPY